VPAPVVAAGEKSSWPEEVQGLGLTVQDAKTDAIKNIAEQMGKFLARQQPPVQYWRPTPDFIKRNVIAGDGARGEDENIDDRLGPAKRWNYHVKNLDLAVIKSLDDECRRGQASRERMCLGTWIALAGALILVGLAVYARLDARRRLR
jgi:hypothetical protein